MPVKPIARYFNCGLTFRWAQGASEVAVKQGYVIEGTEDVRNPERPSEG